MTVSVVIPTYNGAKKIGGVLKSLKSQTHEQFEILIVDDGSTDSTVDEVKNQSAGLSDLRVIQQNNQGRSATRNRGAKEATGDLLIFYDDDTRPANDSISKHVNFHSTHKDAIVCGFPIEDEFKVQSDIQKYKLFLSQKWTAVYKDGINAIDKTTVFLTSANLSLSREKFIKTGGFNELLSDAEDYEFGIRALKDGLDLYFDKSNIALHDDFITCKSYILRQRQYVKAHLVFKEIQSTNLANLDARELKINSFKAVIYSFLSRKYWVDIIENERLKWLPRRIRFKIYDLVITGLSKVYPERVIS